MEPPTPAAPTAVPTTPWLPDGPLPDGSPPGGQLTLLCFPHAGAGASAFRTWDAKLSAATVRPVQPPGREGRCLEPPFRAVGPLVDACLDAVGPALDAPFAVFGHSVGALVAYEFTRALRRAGGPLPAHVFVSGRVAPQVRHPRRGLHELPDDEFLRFVHSMGGLPERMLHSRPFAEMVLPLLRADISLNETYEHEEEEPLDVPLTVFAGREDARVPLRWVHPWARHTTAKFGLHLVQGGHFFPYEQRDAVLALIDAELRDRP